MHSTHFIYGYMASDIWLRTILIVREETRCHHIGYSFRLAARLFYMNQPMSGHSNRIAHTTAFVTPVVEWEIAQWVHPMKDRSDDPSHHERMLLPQSYISFPWTEQEIVQWVHHEGLIRQPMSGCSTMKLHLAPLKLWSKTSVWSTKLYDNLICNLHSYKENC